jgi:hypothetical protein
MTIQDVLDRIAEIRRLADEEFDSEGAHSGEDELHKEVLAAIAEGAAEDPREMARLALTTAEIDFSRWYA